MADTPTTKSAGDMKIPANASWGASSVRMLCDMIEGIQDDIANIPTDNTLTQVQTDLSSLTDRVTADEADISTNKSDIATLKTEVADMGGNASDISDLQSQVATNTQDISDLKTSVSTNTTNIASNASKISTNETDIGTLKTDITELQSDYATYGTTLTGIQSNIATNTNNIATNTSAISGIQSRLTTDETNISNNTTATQTNATNLSNHIAATNNQHYQLDRFGSYNNTYQMSCNGSGVPTQTFTSMSGNRGYLYPMNTTTTTAVTLPNGVAQQWGSTIVVPNGTDGVHSTFTSGNHGVTIKDIWTQFIAYETCGTSTGNYYPYVALYTMSAVNASTPVTQTFNFQRVLAWGNYPTGFVQGQMCIAQATNLNVVIPPNTLYKIMVGFATGNNVGDTRYMYFVGNVNYTVNNP